MGNFLAPEVWEEAERHWPVMVNRARTKIILEKNLGYIHDLLFITEVKQLSYDLEPVGEFFMMAYDPIRDWLIVKDSRD